MNVGALIYFPSIQFQIINYYIFHLICFFFLSLFPGTKVSVKLEEIVQSRQMLKDLPKLSPGPQTAVLEAFHGVVNHFAPKMFGFSYYGMLCRYNK